LKNVYSCAPAKVCWEKRRASTGGVNLERKISPPGSRTGLMTQPLRVVKKRRFSDNQATASNVPVPGFWKKGPCAKKVPDQPYRPKATRNSRKKKKSKKTSQGGKKATPARPVRRERTVLKESLPQAEPAMAPKKKRVSQNTGTGDAIPPADRVPSVQGGGSRKHADKKEGKEHSPWFVWDPEREEERSSSIPQDIAEDKNDGGKKPGKGEP